MNRIVLIGNGFDIAHGLHTRYQDFVDWYWEQRKMLLWKTHSRCSIDILCELRIVTDSYSQWSYFAQTNSNFFSYEGRIFINEIRKFSDMFTIIESPLFKNICHSIESKHWVDIENEYYRLLKDCIKRTGEDEAARKKQVAELNEQLTFLQSKLVEYLASQSIDSINRSIRSNIFAPIEGSEVSVSGYKQFTDSIEYWLQADEPS